MELPPGLSVALRSATLLLLQASISVPSRCGQKGCLGLGPQASDDHVFAL